jgi:predicted transcriptional regulator
MKPPCVVVVQYILPALRVAIARELIETYGFRRVEAAKKMDMTPAAVTQYLKRIRGSTASDLIGRSRKVMEAVSDISRDIAMGEGSTDALLVKMCRACRTARDEGLLCELHKEAMPSLRKMETCTCLWDTTC